MARKRKRKRNYKAEYARRVRKGTEAGKSVSESRGHRPQKTERTARSKYLPRIVERKTLTEHLGETSRFDLPEKHRSTFLALLYKRLLRRGFERFRMTWFGSHPNYPGPPDNHSTEWLGVGPEEWDYALAQTGGIENVISVYASN